MAQPALQSVDSVASYRFPNGLELYCEAVPYVRSVSLGIWIRTGSANETAEQAGVSHFLEHLLFKGTTTRTARQLMEIIEGRGGQINAFTARDCTCLYVQVLDTHLASAVEVLADVLRNSSFFDFEKERNVVLEEIASVEDVPEEYVHDRFVQRLWPDAPIGRPVGGFEETVADLSIDDVRAYRDKWYVPDNMLVTAAGNLDPDALYQMIGAAFADLPPSGIVRAYAAPTFGSGVDAAVRDIAQSHVCIGFPGFPVTDDIQYPCEVLSMALGEGSTSRLFDRIREREGLAYAIYSYKSAYHEAGFLGVYAAVAPENLRRTLSLIGDEIKGICDTPLSDAELSLNKEQIRGGILMGMERTSSRMSRLARSIMQADRIISVDEALERTDAVSADELQRVAQRVFCGTGGVTAIVGPECGDIAEIRL